jgi:hypothetical protein
MVTAATNTVINHPRTKKSGKGIAYYETVMLVLGWSGTLVGVIASGLGYEPKTGWALFGFIILALIGYITCYVYQVAEDEEMFAQEKAPNFGVAPNMVNA